MNIELIGDKEIVGFAEYEEIKPHQDWELV